MLLMMTVNRINHANLALQQARGVLKLLKGLQKSGVDAITAGRIRKELLSLSENLAVTLANRRHYSRELSSGVFEIDPRFLLFEFSHGLLLRYSQVHLIHTLLADMKAGKSVCHQMIMGAGKTTVVGPLVAMLVASSKTMVSGVCL
jgi:ABC-type branched-subunit amino acid transport system ATPase component